MVKRGMMAVLAVILMINAAGCAGRTDPRDVYSEICEKYNQMKSYTAEVEVTVVSNSTTDHYTLEQIYSSEEGYKMTVLRPQNLAGVCCIFAGGDAFLSTLFAKPTVLEQYVPDDKNCLFLPDFFAEYGKSGDGTAVSDRDGEQTRLTTSLSGGNRYRSGQSLWVDNKTLLPVRMETCDENGETVLRVEFTEFVYNAKIDASEFAGLGAARTRE